MTTLVTPHDAVKRWHMITFVVVAGLLTILLLCGGIGDLLILPDQAGFPSVIHRWHEGQAGTLLVIMLGGSMLAMLWRPLSKPLLAQYVVISIGIACLAFATVSGGGFNLIGLASGVVLVGMLVAAYPRPRDLWHVRLEGPLSYPLLAITVIAAILLAPRIARELTWQILGITQQDVHALNYHWLTSVVLALLLILAGSLAATRQAGWQFLGLIAGVAYLYLGCIAIMLPDYAGSWGTLGGVLGLLTGTSYIIATLLELRRTGQATRVAPVRASLERALRGIGFEWPWGLPRIGTESRRARSPYAAAPSDHADRQYLS
jgi:hypothetical protein